MAIVNTIHDHKPHLGDKSSNGSFLSIKLGRIFTDRYIVHSEYVKRNFSLCHNTSEDKIDVVPIGGNSYYHKIFGKKVAETKNTILFFGRLWKYKGLDTLIRAEPFISKEIPDVKIVIAGRGEDLEYYKKRIINRERFLIMNYRIPDEEISELFQKSSLVVLPYHEATQSGIIPLSYLLGKPVVATKVGGLPEQIQDGLQGLLVPPDDEKALASAIIRILKNDNFRKNLGSNSYEYSREKLSDDKIASSTLKVYNRAISDKN